MHEHAGDPPNPTAAFCVPAPAKENRDVIKAPPADQDEPLYSSVQPATPYPPNPTAAF